MVWAYRLKISSRPPILSDMRGKMKPRDQPVELACDQIIKAEMVPT